MCTYMKLLKNSTVKNVTRLHHRCQVNKCPKVFGKRLHYNHIPVTVNAMHLSGDVLQELDTSPKSARAHGRSGPAPTQQWFLGPTRVSPQTSSWLVQLFTQSNRVSNTQIQIMEYVTTVETWPSAL